MGAIKWGGGVEPLLGSSRTKYDNHQAPGIDIFGNPSPLHSPRKRRLTGGADKDYTWYLLLYMAYGLLDAVPLPPPPSLFCFLFFSLTNFQQDVANLRLLVDGRSFQ